MSRAAARDASRATSRTRTELPHGTRDGAAARDVSRRSAGTRAAGDTGRVCTWCSGQIDPSKRADTKTCGVKCRKRKSRWRVAPAGSVADRPMRFAYADPPYPGLAYRYYRCPEVDHAELAARLVRDYPDGWALSTSREALPMVLRLFPAELELRVCPWVRGVRQGRSKRPRNAWEPLIVCGGRPYDNAPPELCDVLMSGGRHRSHPDALVGMKSPAFAEWMFRQLGAQVGDELDDLFRGSGAIRRAWDLYVSRAPAAGTLPSRLEDATRALDAALA